MVGRELEGLFGLCYFGHVAVIRRCNMIFWEFYGG
jgi:hypothetical protein